MEPVISNKLQNLTPYDPDIDNSLVHMDANESFLATPERIRQTISSKVLDIEYNRYPDPLATKACEAFGAFYGVSPELITAGNGSDELIAVIMNSFIDKGGKVLFTKPDFSMYAFYCDSYECVPVVIGKDRDLTFDPDVLIRAANEEKVSLIIFSNPCNPTGQGFSRETILKIVNSVGCVVVVDEAYMDFWDQSALDSVTETDNMIVLKTCSKIGFAAARMGFAIANKKLTGYLRAAKSPYNVNALTQAAAEVFLSDKDFLTESISEIKASREDLYSHLKALEADYPGKILVFASHTNFIRVQSQMSQKIHSLLKQQGISIRLASPDALRITVGSNEENKNLLRYIKEIMTQI